jgi:hypothetical protein
VVMGPRVRGGDIVGMVERSDNPSRYQADGFRKGSTHPTGYGLILSLSP